MANEERNGGDQVDLSDLSRYSSGSQPAPHHETPAEDAEIDEDGLVTPGRPSGVRSFFTSVGARVVVGLLIAGGWWLFTSLDDASRDDGGEIVGGGDLGVMSMQVGDCFNDPSDLEEVVYDVAAVPCSEPHDNEVFAVGSIGSNLGEDFPGRSPLEQYSYDNCVDSFFGYVGVDYAESSLGVFTFTPTEESWAEGDREFVCALYSIDLGGLTGTARGSGL